MENLLNFFEENLNYMILAIVLAVAVIVTIIAVCVIRKKKKSARSSHFGSDGTSGPAGSKAMFPYEDPKKEFPASDSLEKGISELKAKKQAQESTDTSFRPAQKKKTNDRQEPPEDLSGIKFERSEKKKKKHKDAAKPKMVTQTVESKPVADKADEAKENKKPADEKNDEDEQVVKYAGKWIIHAEDDDRYYADLRASNGEIMLKTEGYTSLSGVKSGIKTLKKNIENENFAINIDKNDNFVFKIFSTANRLLCIGEGYSTRDQCEKAFASVKRFAKTAVITVEKPEDKN